MHKLYYFAATPAGDFWEVKRGHVFPLGREEFVVTGWDAKRHEVYVSRDTQHRVITSRVELWDRCNMQFRRSAAEAQ